MHDLLARRRTVEGHGLDGIFCRMAEQTAKLFRFATEQLSHALAAGEKANGHAGVGMARDVVEEHGGAFPGRALDCAARADIAVNAGELSLGLDLHVGLDKLAGDRAQKRERTAQIMYRIRHGHSSFL